MLSPYRDQVNYLTRMLAQKLKSKILQDHDIAVGTAHTFQGDERDIMLLSFCADPSSHRSTVTFMNNDNLFNVAVTRARHRQVIFTGLDARNLPQDHLLGQYLDYAADCLEPDKPEDHTCGGTAFEREVAAGADASASGYEVYLGYPVAGFAVDVVAQHGGQALAIACDGDPERHAPLPGEASLDTVAARRSWSARAGGCIASLPPLAARPRAGAGGDRRDDGRRGRRRRRLGQRCGVCRRRRIAVALICGCVASSGVPRLCRVASGKPKRKSRDKAQSRCDDHRQNCAFQHWLGSHQIDNAQ